MRNAVDMSELMIDTAPFPSSTPILLTWHVVNLFNIPYLWLLVTFCRPSASTRAPHLLLSRSPSITSRMSDNLQSISQDIAPFLALALTRDLVTLMSFSCSSSSSKSWGLVLSLFLSLISSSFSREQCQQPLPPFLLHLVLAGGSSTSSSHPSSSSSDSSTIAQLCRAVIMVANGGDILAPISYNSIQDEVQPSQYEREAGFIPTSSSTRP